MYIFLSKLTINISTKSTPHLNNPFGDIKMSLNASVKDIADMYV